ncbi:unnamed protein product [Amoebophrya sp. A120]|nr:unnamed protein product [Amoebophrya sp. A120]|eukprot:GSA120T00006140001.1
MKSGMLPGTLSRAKILRALCRFLLFSVSDPLSLLNGGCDLVGREACNGFAFALRVTTNAAKARHGSTRRLAQAQDMAAAGADADKVNPTAVLSYWTSVTSPWSYFFVRYKAYGIRQLLRAVRSM